MIKHGREYIFYNYSLLFTVRGGLYSHLSFTITLQSKYNNFINEITKTQEEALEPSHFTTFCLTREGNSTAQTGGKFQLVRLNK